TQDFDDDAATKGTQAWIAYGVGAAGLATGIALLALRGRDAGSETLGRRESPHSVRLMPYVTANAFGVAGQF
ncbi:MAG TPA: hypothetical protein VFU02_11400, partial [Polyangiaceae bacterium]|nr:hypothetical protein [Polyangiaceae bacterium]